MSLKLEENLLDALEQGFVYVRWLNSAKEMLCLWAPFSVKWLLETQMHLQHIILNEIWC